MIVGLLDNLAAIQTLLESKIWSHCMSRDYFPIKKYIYIRGTALRIIISSSLRFGMTFLLRQKNIIRYRKYHENNEKNTKGKGG